MDICQSIYKMYISTMSSTFMRLRELSQNPKNCSNPKKIFSSILVSIFLWIISHMICNADKKIIQWQVCPICSAIEFSRLWSFLFQFLFVILYFQILAPGLIYAIRILGTSQVDKLTFFFCFLFSPLSCFKTFLTLV